MTEHQATNPLGSPRKRQGKLRWVAYRDDLDLIEFLLDIIATPAGNSLKTLVDLQVLSPMAEQLLVAPATHTDISVQRVGEEASGEQDLLRLTAATNDPAIVTLLTTYLEKHEQCALRRLLLVDLSPDRDALVGALRHLAATRKELRQVKEFANRLQDDVGQLRSANLKLAQRLALAELTVERCIRCEQRRESSIHHTESPNAEIRLGAHAFTPGPHAAEWVLIVPGGQVHVCSRHLAAVASSDHIEQRIYRSARGQELPCAWVPAADGAL